MKNTKSKKPKQLTLDAKEFKAPNPCFGGSLLAETTSPRNRRPIESKLPLHVVIRANRSVLRLPKTFHLVEREIDRWAKLSGVTIYKRANVKNHLHLLVQTTRAKWLKFIRGLTGSLARKLQATGINVGDKLWKHRPFTRIVKGWQKAYKSVKDYIQLNEWEGAGNIDRKQIHSLKQLHARWSDDMAEDLNPPGPRGRNTKTKPIDYEYELSS